jgi:hypothetical protein
MTDAAAELPEPISSSDIIAWFRRNYPRVQKGTVTAHIIGLTKDHPSRHHYPSLARRRPLFVQVSRGPHGQYVRYRSDGYDASSESHPNVEEIKEDFEDEVEEETISNVATMEFALEVYLEEFIVTNWDLIDWSRRLEIWDAPDGRSGHQFSTPVGRLDFLAMDLDTHALVVIELKRGRTSDQVVGQAARYMGWLRERFASPEQAVEGIIVAGETDDRLYFAAAAVPGLTVQEYQVSFSLNPATPRS